MHSAPPGHQTGSAFGLHQAAAHAVDQAVHPAEPYRAKAPTNAIGIVLRRHAKSPCASPLAAVTTRSLSPLPRRMIGFVPLREGRGVVSQIQAV